ncbi:MAG: pyruvate kinase [Chlamydiota bacterium]
MQNINSEENTIRAKIICTIGPASDSKEKLSELVDAGMNITRLNFSHGSHGGYAEIIKRIKEVRREKGVSLGILLDTKGPEVRVGQLPETGMILEENGEYWLVKQDDAEGPNDIPINPFSILSDLTEGVTVLFDDGAISSTVKGIDPSRGARIKVHNTAKLSSRKGVNVPNVALSLPNVTEQDIKDIRFGCQQGIDMIALSFTRSSEHIKEVRTILEDEGREDVLLIAKIENWEGIKNLDSIVQASDGIMVARGDLGVELPISQVPQLQKQIIYTCFLGAKPSITATQMLESMIQNPRPTRAEVSDVANAINEGTSAVMLSGETAAGKHPVEAVKTFHSIISEAEKHLNFEEFMMKSLRLPSNSVLASISAAAVRSAYNSRAKAIFSLTRDGEVIRFLSRLRPSVPIIAFTDNERTFNRLSLYWGVVPLMVTDQNLLAPEHFDALAELAIKQGIVQKGDLIVVTSKIDEGKEDDSSMMIIQSIGDVVFRGARGYGREVHAQAVYVTDPTLVQNIDEKIVVISVCDENYEPIFKQAAGIVLQNLHSDKNSEKIAVDYAKKYHTSLITEAESSKVFFKEKKVVMSPEKVAVYLDDQEW